MICCLAALDDDARAAVASSDEIVTWGPPPLELEERWWTARGVALERGVHLVDWIVCDDLLVRSIKLGLDHHGGDHDESDWWDASTSGP